MRRSRAETAESRRHILAQAKRLFAERGPDGVSVADIMEAAGMTHGGFYKHFASKEALFAEVVTESFEDRFRHLANVSDEGAAAGVQRYLDDYLTLGHAKSLAGGCPIAGLTNETLRGSPDAKKALSDGAVGLLARFTEGRQGEPDAIRALTTAIGAIVLARAVQDDTIRKRILEQAAADTGAKRSDLRIP